MDKMIDVNEAGNQLRLFLSIKNGEKLHSFNSIPKAKKVMEGAEWLRRNGSMCMTNSSFRGLIADIIGRMVSEEEATCARVLTGMVANLYYGNYFDLFVTNEEKDHIEHMVISGEIPSDRKIIVTETVLGWYVQMIP